MSFPLQREVPSKKYSFTTTQFISWKENENSITVYFGDDTLKEYNRIIIYKQSDIYQTAKNILDEGKANAIFPFIHDIYNREYNYFEKSAPTKEAYSENYISLFHQLWGFYPADFDCNEKYCPVNNLELLKEWYKILLDARLDKYKSENVITQATEIEITNSFGEYLLGVVDSKIKQSREWYKTIYTDDGNSYTKYPIRYLKEFREWLSGLIKNPVQEQIPQKANKGNSETEISFLIRGNEQTEITRLDYFLRMLIKLELVQDTTKPVFRNVFRGKKIKRLREKILWTGTIPELKYLINELIASNKIRKINNKWQITSQTFTSPNGNYTTEQLTYNTQDPKPFIKDGIDELMSQF